MGSECTKDHKLVTDVEITDATGKSWQEWFRILDEFGVEERGHSPTVEHLKAHYSLDHDWAELVARRYEDDRGLRQHLT